MYYVYMIECANGAYYTGYTTDIERRYQEHCAGSLKCKYTRSFPPVKLAAYWEIDSGLSDVLKIEAFIKKLTKIKKRLIISDASLLLAMLSEKEMLATVENNKIRIR